MEALLLDAARLAVRIRKSYAAVKRDPAARYYTYVLLLQRGRLYVGNTDNIYQRLLEHRMMSPSASVWVREHGPIVRLVEVCRNCSSDDETYKTLEYMDKFGWESVRGAGWCRSELKAPPAALAEFRRTASKSFDYLSRPEMDDIVASVHDLVADLSSPDRKS